MMARDQSQKDVSSVMAELLEELQNRDGTCTLAETI